MVVCVGLVNKCRIYGTYRGRMTAGQDSLRPESSGDLTLEINDMDRFDVHQKDNI